MFDNRTKNREVTGRGRKTAETGTSILSVISKEMHIEGNCETNGQLRIDGTISGNVSAHGRHSNRRAKTARDRSVRSYAGPLLRPGERLPTGATCESNSAW